MIKLANYALFILLLSSCAKIGDKNGDVWITEWAVNIDGGYWATNQVLPIKNEADLEYWRALEKSGKIGPIKKVLVW